MSEPTSTARPGNAVRSKALLAAARVHMDPCGERGRVCRGAYIVSGNGTEYLTTSGEWTHGITGDHNWWVDVYAAQAFLKSMQANNGGEGRLASSRTSPPLGSQEDGK